MSFKKCIVMVLGLVLFVSSSASLAVASEDFNLSVGSRFWNTFYSTYVYVPGQFENVSMTTPGGGDMVVVPTIAARYKDFVVSGSYWSGDYSFDPRYMETNTSSTTATFDLERSEMDITIGYYIVPKFAITLGYKQIEIDIDAHYVGSDTGGPFDIQSDQKNTISGPFLGFNFSSAFTERFFGFGTLSIGNLNDDYKNGTISESGDATYSSVEVGFTYMPTSWMNLLFSYRVQQILIGSRGVGDSDGKDMIEGPQLGMNLIF